MRGQGPEAPSTSIALWVRFSAGETKSVSLSSGVVCQRQHGISWLVKRMSQALSVILIAGRNKIVEDRKYTSCCYRLLKTVVLFRKHETSKLIALTCLQMSPVSAIFYESWRLVQTALAYVMRERCLHEARGLRCDEKWLRQHGSG